MAWTIGKANVLIMRRETAVGRRDASSFKPAGVLLSHTEACTARAAIHAGGYTTVMTAEKSTHEAQMDGQLAFAS